MFSRTTLLVALAAALSVFASPLTLEKRSIDAELFNELSFYFKYASSSYLDSCPKPNGKTLVRQFSTKVTDTQGFIARDDDKKEIVVALRGSESLTDAIVDITFIQVPFISPGVNAPFGSLVHSGFLTAWNSVALQVLDTVKKELKEHPGYALASTGHSLGGALSSLAGISLKQNFPKSTVRMFTYGQPRVFNPIGAKFINSEFGDLAYRSVHTNDGVPTMVPRLLNFKHHGYEYWQFADPATPDMVKKCDASGEDPTCSDQIPSTGLNHAHSLYYGISSNTTFCS